jgi:hypothetical protein
MAPLRPPRAASSRSRATPPRFRGVAWAPSSARAPPPPPAGHGQAGLPRRRARPCAAAAVALPCRRCPRASWAAPALASARRPRCPLGVGPLAPPRWPAGPSRRRALGAPPAGVAGQAAEQSRGERPLPSLSLCFYGDWGPRVRILG